MTFVTDDITPTPENGENWAHNALRYVVCKGDGFVHFKAVYNALKRGQEITVHRLALLDGSPLAEAHLQARAEVAKIGQK